MRFHGKIAEANGNRGRVPIFPDLPVKRRFTYHNKTFVEYSSPISGR